MSEFTLVNTVALPIGLGLLGFVEPCSIGSSLVFIKYIEAPSTAAKVVQVSVFALTRALLIGALGALVALIGTVFLGLQKGAWILLGLLYIAIGAFYAFGKAGFLMRTFSPGLSRLVGMRGSIGLGLLFGLNIPACAAPLIFALLGAAALGGGTGGTVALGFLSLGLFGLALSLPLVLAVLWEPGRRVMDRLAGLSVRVPVMIGIVLRPRPLVHLLRTVRQPGGLGMTPRVLARGLSSPFARYAPALSCSGAFRSAPRAPFSSPPDVAA